MTESQNKKELIGEILIRRNMVTPAHLDEALARQKAEGGYVGEWLIKLGYLDEYGLVVALVVQCSLPYISVNKYDIDPRVVAMVSADEARKLRLVPLDRVGDVLSVVMVNPLDDDAKKRLEGMTQCKIAAFIATKSEIEEALNRLYK